MSEEFLSKQRAVELWDKKIISNFEVGTTKGLQKIHHYLFQDVFDFAGEIRQVNISKGNVRFAPTLFLYENLKIIDNMPTTTFDEIINKYVEMNMAHPFREGNGRSTRLWFDVLLKKELGVCADWDKIGKEEYLSAMERSPVNSLEIKVLLKKALTNKTDDRQVYVCGLQRSYIYENMSEYDVSKFKNRSSIKENDR